MVDYFPDRLDVVALIDVKITFTQADMSVVLEDRIR